MKKKYFIRVNYEYFLKKYPDFNIMDDNKRQDILSVELQLISEMVNSDENKKVFLTNDIELFEIELGDKDFVAVVTGGMPELKVALDYLKKRAIRTDNISGAFTKQLVSVMPSSEVEAIIEMVLNGEFTEFINKKNSQLPLEV
jgi:hypothetical protein